MPFARLPVCLFARLPSGKRANGRFIFVCPLLLVCPLWPQPKGSSLWDPKICLFVFWSRWDPKLHQLIDLNERSSDIIIFTSVDPKTPSKKYAQVWIPPLDPQAPYKKHVHFLIFQQRGQTRSGLVCPGQTRANGQTGKRANGGSNQGKRHLRKKQGHVNTGPEKPDENALSTSF